MTGLQDQKAPPRRRLAAFGRALLATGFIAAGAAALGQDQAALVKDAIFARKILMDSINNNMDEIEAMTNSSKSIDLNEAHEHADVISVMLMAFPHLFPANTNQWKPNVDRDPGRDTYAAPDLWTSYAVFYSQAATASKIAYNASRAKEVAQFKTFVKQLRDACDGCHAAFLKSDQ